MKKTNEHLNGFASRHNRCHILLVDDMPEILEAEKQLLVESGIGEHVEIANSAQRAIERMEQGAFDLVILDLMSNLKMGLGVLKELKQNFDVVVIVYTDVLDQISPEILIREGADKVLSKPASLDFFINSIHAVMRNRSKIAFVRNGHKKNRRSNGNGHHKNGNGNGNGNGHHSNGNEHRLSSH